MASEDGAASAPLRFAGFDPSVVLHGVAGRQGGVSVPPYQSLNLSVKSGDDRWAVAENRRRFERLLGFERRQAAFGRLCHGREVAVFQAGGMLPAMEPPELGWPMFFADAAVSNIPGLMLIMTFADCAPVLLLDEHTRSCALIHAGWRGTVLRIVSGAVRAMAASFGAHPAGMRAAIGPCIGAECYQVGGDVRHRFDEAYGSDAARFFAMNRLDLVAANSFDLESAGVLRENIETANMCTACDTDRFFSHRAESGETGRFGACVGVRYPGRFGFHPNEAPS